MENKKEKINDQIIYDAVFLSEEHLQGKSKEGKDYNIGKVSFQLVLPHTDKKSGEVTVRKITVDAIVDPSNLPNGALQEYSACKAVYQTPLDPTYGKLRFVKLI